MSVTEISTTIRSVQRRLGLRIDGVAGPVTWDAIDKAIPGAAAPTSTTTAPVLPHTTPALDARTEGNIARLLPPVQDLARQFMELLAAHEITARITSGLRDDREQEALYEIGRTRPNEEGKWKIVTNARAGESNHNFGLAFDITLFDGGKPVYESPLYRAAGTLGKSLGLLWGGDWTSGDEPHFEFRPEWARDLTENEALAAYRERTQTQTALV